MLLWVIQILCKQRHKWPLTVHTLSVISSGRETGPFNLFIPFIHSEIGKDSRECNEAGIYYDGEFRWENLYLFFQKLVYIILAFFAACPTIVPTHKAPSPEGEGAKHSIYIVDVISLE